jgi:sterol desaturase/sphingolipid hydroxylase (fatty acid hydroxylase superfamily)
MSTRSRRVTAAIAIAGAFGVLAVLERRRPLRRQTQSGLARLRVNFALGAMSLAVWICAALVVKRPKLRSPRPTDAISILLLDYTLWWWHRWNHEWPALWRFHLVHHTDRDLDASTAFRFHFGEHFLSFFYRTAQVAIIRPSETALWLWETTLFVSILFHHANLQLPAAVDSRLVRWIVTPRMHGIHHSEAREHANANYASLFSWWDGLHRTLVLDVAQDEITIGAPDFDAHDIGLIDAVTLPLG